MPWASASASKQEARYSCQIAVLKRDPASDSLRYHYGRLNLHFDDEILERASGPAASWRYRVPMEGNPERMVLAMDCIIPMSRETSEMMSQVVGHERRTDEARTIRPSIVPPGARSTITAAPPTIAANVIDGSVPNADGYICPPTYNWLSPDQQYCIDAGGNLSLPDVMVFEDPWPPGGGGDPGEEPCHLCDMRDDCDDPTELCFEDGHGGGFPIPRDPCQEENPPAWCLNRCETGDALLDRLVFQEEAEALWLEAYGPPGQPRDQSARIENGSWIYELASGALQFERMNASHVTSCTMRGISMPSGSNLIGVLHSHPFSDGEVVGDPNCLAARNYSNPVSYHKGPSRADSTLANHPNIDAPIYILDSTSVYLLEPGHNRSDAVEHNRCGY